MKKCLFLVLALTLVFSLAAANAQTVLQLSEVHAEGYPTSLADAEFARLVEERTEGRIKIDVHFGGTLYGAEPDAIQALQLGDLAFTRVSASPVSNFVSSTPSRCPTCTRAAHMWCWTANRPELPGRNRKGPQLRPGRPVLL